jgi:hypothetical protein
MLSRGETRTYPGGEEKWIDCSHGWKLMPEDTLELCATNTITIQSGSVQNDSAPSCVSIWLQA